MPKVVPIKLDKDRHLKFSGLSMLKFEEATGKSFKNIDSKNMTDKEMYTVIWSCLVHEDKTLTLEQVADSIDTDNIQSVQDALTQAINPTSLPTG